MPAQPKICGFFFFQRRCVFSVDIMFFFINVDYVSCEIKVQGCACDAGTFMDHEKDARTCVDASQCSCYDFMNNKVYAVGETVQENCRQW